jgi:hypothetical protein
MAKTIPQLLHSFFVQCVGGRREGGGGFLYHVASECTATVSITRSQQLTARSIERDTLGYCELYSLSAWLYEVFTSPSQ